jgi:hypothetical protein
MNKYKSSFIMALSLSCISFASQASYVIKFENSASKDIIPEPSTLVAQNNLTCKNILENGNSTGNGIYEIRLNNKTFNAYCDMTKNGGGWTMA